MARGVAALSMQDLIKGLPQVPHLIEGLLLRRPDLLTSKCFWIRDLAPADLAVSTLADRPEIRSAGIAAMIGANRDDLAPIVVRKFGALDVLRLISAQFHLPGSDKLALRQMDRPGGLGPGDRRAVLNGAEGLIVGVSLDNCCADATRRGTKQLRRRPMAAGRSSCKHVRSQ